MPLQTDSRPRRRARPLWRLTLHQRVLDGLPGLLAWLALPLTVAGALWLPQATLTLGALLVCYSALHFLAMTPPNLLGLRRCRQWARRDWPAAYARRAGPQSLPGEVLAREAVQHLVILPSLGEPPALLCRSLDRLAAQEAAAQRITVVLALEAADPAAQATADALNAAYAGRFARFLYTLHPAHLPGESQCKSANLRWALRVVRARLAGWGLDRDAVLVTVMDADTLWHPAHFAALSTLFALNPGRHCRVWQAPLRYHANTWDVPPPLRLVHAYSAAWELAYLAAPWWPALPISSYSLSLRLLERSGGWDGDVIADEWHTFLRADARIGGGLRLEAVYLPFLANATGGDSWWTAAINRYRQTLRHAWGAKEMGYALGNLLADPVLRTRHGWNLLLRTAHDFLLAGAGWVIMTVGSALALLLHPGLARLDNAAFLLLNLSWAVVWLLGLAFGGLDGRLRPPRRHPATAGERVAALLGYALLPALTFVFLALPALHAQTLLLLGRRIPFEVTEKR